jgi:hypothetical protein
VHFSFRRTHDLLLPLTLLCDGAKIFPTRKNKDFVEIGFQHVTNPLDTQEF